LQLTPCRVRDSNIVSLGLARYLLNSLLQASRHVSNHMHRR
jgi:hypothetical protein